jgi:hypothetical protein
VTIQLFDNVLNPESGIHKAPAQFPPMGANPSASGRTPPPMAAPPRPASTEMAKRTGSLDGKTVYLVDTGYGGSYKFMIQLQKWFAEHMPSVKTIRKRKPGNVFMDDNDSLWEEIKQKGDAAVLGVAG